MNALQSAFINTVKSTTKQDKFLLQNSFFFFL